MSSKLRILFVGDNWSGSSDRSLREALVNIGVLNLKEISVDQHISRHQLKVLRACDRFLRPLHMLELDVAIKKEVRSFKPDVFLAYKGNGVRSSVLEYVKSLGVLTVNVFPDCSPHAHGKRLKQAVGVYDLIVSTKPFHPRLWNSVYGYANDCVWVPHGYDPVVHLWESLPEEQDLDVVLAANWRSEYHDLMLSLAERIADLRLKVGIAGHGWTRRGGAFPPSWRFEGAISGRSYGEFLRRGKIAIAPVTRDIIVDGVQQPGDEDSTRTYELAAAHCFFVHRRTDYLRNIFDERDEVPMWDNADEMSDLIRYFVVRSQERRQMATAAHRRAVPYYSISSRAKEIVVHLEQLVAKRRRAMHV